MLSGGIDSPVAGYLAMKRGIKIEAVYFEAIPSYELRGKRKSKTLTRKLAKYQGMIHLHIVPFTEIQEEIYKKCQRKLCDYHYASHDVSNYGKTSPKK